MRYLGEKGTGGPGGGRRRGRRGEGDGKRRGREGRRWKETGKEYHAGYVYAVITRNLTV
jgi:hypothetical protein